MPQRQSSTSPKKQQGGRIEGNELRKELEGKKVMNANVLDYLLANPKAIPDDWKQAERGNTRYIYFWGTIYSRPEGGLYVRCLCWSSIGGQWSWTFNRLVDDWYLIKPALLAK